jgi:hypothetical protein
MTSLVAWVSVDSRAPSGCYLVSDSRISYLNGQPSRDSGRKLFISERFPDLFGICGDVDFPTHVLRHMTGEIDSGRLLQDGDSSIIRHELLAAKLQRAYPSFEHHRRSTLLHFSREGDGLRCTYRLWRLDWSPTGKPESLPVDLPTDSAIAISLGSGGTTVVKKNEQWKRALGRTARGVFSSFCDALETGDDPYSGGPPQLVCLYRVGAARTVGVVVGGQRYVAGSGVQDETLCQQFEWRNRLFERVDPRTLSLLPGAQKQPRPKL